MALSAGTRLGPYEVLSAIGAGGMGEVYRARDTRIGRDVAVKVLPGGMSSSDDRLRRFEQEARLAGSLNHPNVLTLFDVVTHDAAPCIVTELLEGRSLREVLADGPVPPRKAVEYAQQIARGLGAAHERGVVHRDLKPANVFVTKDGRVKVLDFGLAKLVAPLSSRDEASKLSTETAEGRLAVVGTVGYMAPEQVRGQPVDARSDVFALGTVVYEMLSGRRAFSGDTVADTMTAILTRDPEELSRPGLEIPPGLERIVRRCLEKEPAERFQSAKDVAFALEAESGTSRSVMDALGAPSPARRRRRAALLGLLPLLAGVGLGLVAGRGIRPRALPGITQLTFRRGVVDCARFAPDGKTVVYSALWDGQAPELFTTRLESPESRSLGLPAAQLMGVSSRGELAILLKRPGELGQGAGTLARVPLLGGEPRRVVDDVLVADWSPDGQELAVIRNVDNVLELEYPIGRVLARPALGSHLRVSPRGDRVAIGSTMGVAVFDTSGRRSVWPTPPAVWGLAWASNDSLWVTGGRTQDARSVWLLTADGPPREVYRVTGTLGIQDAAGGRLLVHHGFERVGVRARPPGGQKELELGVFNWSWVADLSADGRQLLIREGVPGVLTSRAESTTYLRPTGGGEPVRLGEGAPLALSPSGKWALIGSLDPDLRLDLTPTGAGERRVLERGSLSYFAGAWFLDEDHLVLDGGEKGRGVRTFLLDLSDGHPRPIGPEGVMSIRGSASAGSLLGVAEDGTLARYPLEGGSAQPLPARLPAGGYPLRASADGRFVFVGSGVVPYRVDRLELATGRLSVLRVLQPDDLTGVPVLMDKALSADGEAYAYTYGRYLEDLFLVEGLRP